MKNMIKNVDNCYLTSYDVDQLSEIIKKVIELNIRSNGRKFIKKYDLKIIAERVFKIYQQLK